MTIPQIDVDELEVAWRDGARVIDVREPHEYAEARIPGAILVPMATVPERLGDLEGGERVYVVCATGARSARVVEFLVANNFDAVNVAGGTMAWIDSGRQFEGDRRSP